MPKDISIDKPLDKHLKPVKDSDGTLSALEISTDKVRVKDLDVAGTINGADTVNGVDIVARDAILTSTTATANAALPKAGGTMTGDINLAQGDKITFDGGGDTSIRSSQADNLVFKVGGNSQMILSETSTTKVESVFKTGAVSFFQKVPTYNASDTEVYFSIGSKQRLVFGAGNITDMNLNMPANSGNFVLLLRQDGTGSRTVTNWKVFATDDAAAGGSATVVWQGGSSPTLTTTADKTDILSFYWDATNEVCYGVASLNF